MRRQAMDDYATPKPVKAAKALLQKARQSDFLSKISFEALSQASRNPVRRVVDDNMIIIIVRDRSHESIHRDILAPFLRSKGPGENERRHKDCCDDVCRNQLS